MKALAAFAKSSKPAPLLVSVLLPMHAHVEALTVDLSIAGRYNSCVRDRERLRRKRTSTPLVVTTLELPISESHLHSAHNRIPVRPSAGVCHPQGSKQINRGCGPHRISRSDVFTGGIVFRTCRCNRRVAMACGFKMPGFNVPPRAANHALLWEPQDPPSCRRIARRRRSTARHDPRY